MGSNTESLQANPALARYNWKYLCFFVSRAIYGGIGKGFAREAIITRYQGIYSRLVQSNPIVAIQSGSKLHMSSLITPGALPLIPTISHAFKGADSSRVRSSFGEGSFNGQVVYYLSLAVNLQVLETLLVFKARTFLDDFWKKQWHGMGVSAPDMLF